MRKKAMWLIVSCLMVVALLLTSCGEGVTEEEEEVAPPMEEEVAPPAEEEEVVAPTAEEPRYGGIFKYAGVQLIGFDEAYVYPWTLYNLYLTNEELLTGDITKGMGGTGEASWLSDEFFLELETGLLESILFTQPSADPDQTERFDRSVTLKQLEIQHILNALEQTGGNKRKAAKQLGISETALHAKLNRYKLRDNKKKT